MKKPNQPAEGTEDRTGNAHVDRLNDALMTKSGLKDDIVNAMNEIQAMREGLRQNDSLLRDYLMTEMHGSFMRIDWDSIHKFVLQSKKKHWDD